MGFGKGAAIWISGFFTFMAGLNTFNAVMLWVYKGADLIIEPYLMNNILGIGGMSVTGYFWISLIATFGFLGLTSIVAYSGPSPYQAILKMIGEVEEGLADNQRKIESTRVGLFAKLETDRMERQQLFDTVNANIGNARKEMLDAVDRQGKALRKDREDLFYSVKTGFDKAREEMLGVLEKRGEAIQKDLLSTTQANFSNIRKEMRDMLEKQGKALQMVERSGKQSTAVLQKQRMELEDVKARLETLERELTLPKPRLNSHNAPEEIKGIGPRLGVELRSIGITNVGELITTDPIVIAEKTPISLEMATRFQARAQLLTVPGVDDNDVELLEEVGIRSRRELANQDPIHLSRRIADVAKAYVEQGKITESENPTIEEVSSWIKHAKP